MSTTFHKEKRYLCVLQYCTLQNGSPVWREAVEKFALVVLCRHMADFFKVAGRDEVLL